MSQQPTAAFAINLVQDVNILRPLIFMATKEFGFNATVLISPLFPGRDPYGIWRAELEEISSETGAQLKYYENEWEAFRQLTGLSGLLFAGSESHLPNHSTTHDLFRLAPPGFLRVTLQHGFECVGFRHSADHVRAHGETVSFGGDIVCSWAPVDALPSMAASQRSKVVVTGPTALLQVPDNTLDRFATPTGIVCENLHSVRFRGTGDFKTEFVDAFDEFCGLLQRDKREAVLRPHPGGQYVLKNKVRLPANARIDNSPMYRLDLRRFSYGISAPSSVLIDMLLARIPTAVWRDRDRAMDSDSYAGLTTVSTPAEWHEFARQAEADPQPYIEIQEAFLRSTGMPLAPRDVFIRFAELFRASQRREARPLAALAERDRLLFIANGNVPTLQLSFEKPLAALVARGLLTTGLMTEGDFAALANDEDREGEQRAVDQALDSFAPTAVIFCRYSGPAHRSIINWAKSKGVPTVYHIDDDLLAIPTDIGDRKHAFHNAPKRLESVRSLLTSVDLVYASTGQLKKKLEDYFPQLDVLAGKIYCSGSVIQPPQFREPCTVGYMASADHAHNLTMILPAIEKLLEKNPDTGFRLFGSIPIPGELKRFGDRVATSPPVANYATFLQEFASQRWDIGICPLVPIEFNLMKADTKWVEYVSCGLAVVASRGTAYDHCCADGCGLLASNVDEWFEALDHLVNHPEERIALASRAQEKLGAEYGLSRLREQVLTVIETAKGRAALRMCPQPELQVTEVD